MERCENGCVSAGWMRSGQAGCQLAGNNLDRLFFGYLQGFKLSISIVIFQGTAVLCRVVYLFHVPGFSRPRPESLGTILE